MSDLFIVVLSGVISGSAYALLALGIVIIFRSTDTVHFAIGDTGTLAVFVAVTAISYGSPVVVALVIAILFAGLFGIVTERVLIRPLGTGHGTIFVALVVTIGLGMLIHAVIGIIWGHREVPFPPLVGGTASIAGVSFGLNNIVATLLGLVAMGAIAWFFGRTPIGTAMRGSADDPFAARLVGISPGKVAAIAWFLGCSMSAIAAFFLAAANSLTANLTLGPLFRAFAGVFLGGLTSMSGATLGGFAIGVLDNIAGRYISANYRDTIVFAVIVLVLFLRPAGFLGRLRQERV